MISKKSRKVVAALLIGATVCASGTFAYFNSVADMNKINNGGAMQTLDITNGRIYVSASFKGQGTTDVTDWSYDVARLSTLGALGVTTGQKDPATGVTITDPIKTSLTTFTGYSGGNISTTSDFVVKTSPDITGFDFTRPTGEGVTIDQQRLAIGTDLTGAVTKARPGDAIVLGKAAADGSTTTTGITIVNDSNITCKARIQLADPTDSSASVVKELKALKEAGWVMYLNDTLIKFDNIEATDEGIDQINKILANQAVELAKGTSQTINMRFELPLLRDNAYQNKDNSSGPTGEAFNLSKLLQVTVTQENNPGWNNDGTSTNPATSTPNNGTDSTGTVHDN